MRIEDKKAFESFIRKGIPSDLSLKQDTQEHPTTHYIWRTRGDGKVRSRHADNDGKIFAWDNPPPTGHPGEDYNCRCIAEPYYPGITEYLDITFSGVADTGPTWSWPTFVDHYFTGQGRAVRLRDTGNLQIVVNAYRKEVIDDPKRLPSDIVKKARENPNGSFSDYVENGYVMKDIVFSLGKTKIRGEFSGHSYEEYGVLTLSGTIDFFLEDIFEDPLDTYNLTAGTTEIYGSDIYRIYDTWSGQFSGRVHLNPSKSLYAK